jgi:hypothetical protein
MSELCFCNAVSLCSVPVVNVLSDSLPTSLTSGANEVHYFNFSLKLMTSISTACRFLSDIGL